MSRLIVISNRVTMPGSKEAGGLAVALQEALKAQGGIWCGWSGKRCRNPETAKKRAGNVDYLTLDFEEKDYQDFYVGFCNSLLWPLFHYQLGLTNFNRDMFDGYERVNRRFAEVVAQHTRSGDTLWVHDYQLLTLGRYLREAGIQERTGFFLHIPFPVPEVLTALPVYEEILQGLSAYDLIGFQTVTDLQAFIRCITELAGGAELRTLDDGIIELQAFGRKFRAGCFPISIDTEDMVRAAAAAVHSAEARQLYRSLNGRSMLIGVDRLDYTKGLTQRLEAFNHFLHTSPEYSGKVSYVQITPTSRDEVDSYKTMREQLEGLAARINGTNADIDWVPIRYINRSFSRKTLAGFYRLAQVGLVTSLRDGMNLVAKEYAACQNPDDPGMLLLSEFAGAAHELDTALIVNPFNIEATGEAIARALSMPLEERRERHAAMMAVLRRNDIFTWTERFLAGLASKPEKPRLVHSTYPLPLTAAAPEVVAVI